MVGWEACLPRYESRWDVSLSAVVKSQSPAMHWRSQAFKGGRSKSKRRGATITQSDSPSRTADECEMIIRKGRLAQPDLRGMEFAGIDGEHPHACTEVRRYQLL